MEHIRILQPPNYDVHIDAPQLIDSGYSGLIIHGLSDAQELIDNFFRDCFATRQATKTIDGLAQYYKVNNVVWIEIGKGSPWKAHQHAGIDLVKSIFQNRSLCEFLLPFS
jgi:hypothetical protein